MSWTSGAARSALVLFATVEVILFAWVFGMDKAWTEMHVGSDITIPRIYRFIIKYITPAFLLLILGFWFVQEWIPTILLRNVAPENKWYIIGIRLMLVGFFALLVFLVWRIWKRKETVRHFDKAQCGQSSPQEGRVQQ